MNLYRKIKPTITPFGLNTDDELELTLNNGRCWKMKLLEATAEVVMRGFNRYHDKGHSSGDVTVYAFTAKVLINGHEHTFRREVGSQACFYEPWTIDDVRIWFDAVACAFKENGGFMEEKDWKGGIICKPTKLTRWAVQQDGLPICPEPLGDWYPNLSGTLDIRNCYTGEDCWMGPYNGGAAHGGLDINMPAETILTAPFNLDDHYLYNSLAAGYNNNRWVATRRWADGATWELRTSHLIDMLVPERTPLKRGTPYSTTAGTFVGCHEHTHFVWRIFEQGGAYFLDPWILMNEIWKSRGKDKKEIKV